MSKLDSAGNFIWAKRMWRTGRGIAVDIAGNVYTTGYFNGTGDFDPGPGTFNLTSAGVWDIFVSKLDSAGGFVWAKRMGGTEPDWGFGIAMDATGNVYTTGYFEGTVDFDPGPGTFNLTSASSWEDVFVLKLDGAGNFVWAKRMGGTGVDAGWDIAVNGAGNVYTTGHFQGTTDFDPGPGTFNLTSAGSTDIFVSELDSAGDFVWAKSMGGTSGDYSRGIAVDGAGNVYTTGHFQGTGDFDPGPGTFNLTSAGNSDIFVSKLSGPDLTPPNATSITPSTAGPTNAVSVDFAVTFDEDVQGFNDAADVVINHSGTASTGVGVAGSGDMYTVSVTGITGDGSFTLAASTGSDVQDLAANPLATSVTSAAVLIDNTPPNATISLLTASPTGADTVDFEVAFDEAVTPTFDAGDVSLTGTLAGSVGISGTDPAYTVTVTLTDPNADGTIGIAVAGGGAVTDLAGNPYAGGSSALCDVFNWNGFTEQPQAARKYTEDAHAFSVAADCGASTLAYQWKWDDGAKAIHDVGTDAASCAIPDVTGKAGDYWCEVSYDGSTYPSAAATLDVEDHLEITVQPVGGSYTVGGSHTFSVSTSGGYTPLTYTWKQDGLSVGTDATLVLEPLQVAHSGDYTVEVIDDNVDVAISSPTATLTVDVGTPVAGLMGLGMLASGLALAGLLAVRRRK